MLSYELDAKIFKLDTKKMVKQILIILLFVFSTQVLFCQCEDSLYYIGVSIADEMPATIEAIKDSIQKILICPDTVIDNHSGHPDQF